LITVEQLQTALDKIEGNRRLAHVLPPRSARLLRARAHVETNRVAAAEHVRKRYEAQPGCSRVLGDLRQMLENTRASAPALR
jgi:hypothetical protein